MGIFDWFRRPPPIDDRAALIDFLDSRAAFLVAEEHFRLTRGRRRSVVLSMIIKESRFPEAVEVARWKNYPARLSVRRRDGARRAAARGRQEPMPLARGAAGAALAVFDRYPVPAALGEGWKEAREASGLAGHPDRAAPAEVREGHSAFRLPSQFFDNLPIHERLARKRLRDEFGNQLRTQPPPHA